MIIKNYGRYWKRSAVNWGNSKRFGDLGAIGEKNKGGANFRDQIAVYLLHDANYETVYVGQTGKKNKKLLSRLSDHNRNPRMQRWDYFSWFGFRAAKINGDLENFDESTEITLDLVLDQFEALMILLTQPKFNYQRGKWKGAEEYFQIGTEKQWGYTLNDVYEKLSSIEQKLKPKGRTSR